MKLNALRLSNFQSFGEDPTTLTLQDVTYLIGSNGAGKTTVLQALCRLFGFEPSLRRVLRSDFHVPYDEKDAPDERHLWIEADFIFPELEDEQDNTTVPPNFAHMRLDDSGNIPRVRYRLTATMDADREIEDHLLYVLDVNDDDAPLITAEVPKAERHQIQGTICQHAAILPTILIMEQMLY